MRVSGYTSACAMLAGIAVLACTACAKTDNGASADSTKAAAATSTTTAVTTPAAASTTAATLADFAGTWNMRAVPETGKDTTPTEYVLRGAADSTSWKVAYKKGPTLPLKVTLSGDSLIIDTPEHMSVRGKGIKVTTHGVYRRSGDSLVGRTVAHYSKGTDSVLTLRAEGRKAP